MKYADFPLMEWGAEGGGAKDIHYAFFGNVVRGKSAFFKLVVRNGFAHFVWKVFARKKLKSGKFSVVAPLPTPSPNLNSDAQSGLVTIRGGT